MPLTAKQMPDCERAFVFADLSQVEARCPFFAQGAQGGITYLASMWKVYNIPQIGMITTEFDLVGIPSPLLLEKVLKCSEHDYSRGIGGALSGG